MRTANRRRRSSRQPIVKRPNGVEAVADQVKAADLLSADHPAHGAFVRFLGGKEPSKRQARKFLAAHPNFRGEYRERKREAA